MLDVDLHHGAATDVGLVRKVNEDSYLVAPPVFVVADGMGGHSGGDVASQIVVEEFQRLAESYDPRRGAELVADVLTVSALDPATQLVTVSARLRPGPAPVPNGSVTAFSYRYGDAGGIILPEGAVQLEPGRRFVFVVTEGRAERLEVEVIGEAEGQVAVLGVDEGAQVIFPIPTNLRPGAPVTAQTVPMVATTSAPASAPATAPAKDVKVAMADKE